jgi:hypothetical protein
MIFYKAKRSNRKVKAIVGIVLVLSLLGGFFLYRYFTSEESCVQMAYPDGENPASSEETFRCFASQAEALSYISDGRIVLPENASPEEIDAAINQYNSEMATREANGE